MTKVDVGDGATLEIVCGAQNLAVGQLVPVAVPGSELPGGRRIGRTKIRGAVSNGMLCSPIELGLGDDADGILILGTGEEHRLGMDLGEAVGGTVLDVDVKPNRLCAVHGRLASELPPHRNHRRSPSGAGRGGRPRRRGPGRDATLTCA